MSLRQIEVNVNFHFLYPCASYIYQKRRVSKLVWKSHFNRSFDTTFFKKPYLNIKLLVIAVFPNLMELLPFNSNMRFSPLLSAPYVILRQCEVWRKLFSGLTVFLSYSKKISLSCWRVLWCWVRMKFLWSTNILELNVLKDGYMFYL